MLIFLLPFENSLAIPPWLQVVGRMHPLLVHFPIVLVMLYALGSLVMTANRNVKNDEANSINDVLLIITAFTSVATALMGLFLSREEGYDRDALQLHKWGGIILSLFTLAWFYFRKQLQSKKFLPYATSLLALLIIIITGHQGAAITHGEDFLLAPVTKEKEKAIVPFDEALVFNDMVKPIMEEKCLSCHNSKKAKGDLIMESEELLLKGGKNGKLWDTTAADLGLLLQRLHLPLDQKKHMPPRGKPQLTDEELEIVAGWVKKGSDFTLRVADLPPDDSLRLIGVKLFMNSELVQYEFEEADPSLVAKLNTGNRVVVNEAIGSPALTVNFFNSSLFDAKQLQELSPIKKQIVSLDLSKMPVSDADIKIISQFENLRRLYLNFTNITGAAFQDLQKLQFLRTLSVSGTKVTGEQLSKLKVFPKLKTVYAWNVPVDSATIRQIAKTTSNIRFETGFRGDTIMLKLSPPLLQNEEFIITTPTTLKLKHYLPGVQIRYTINGEEPDSIHSPIYKSGEVIKGNVTVKARAYKPGWISSDLVERMFLLSQKRPDTISLLTAPDSSYSGRAALLVDRDKGTTNFREGSWLAWRRNPMEILLEYHQPVEVQCVTLSSMVHVNSYILPPLSLEVWGGDSRGSMKLLGRLVPNQPAPVHKDSLGKLESHLATFECKFEPSTIRYIKVIGKPVPKMPAWHPAKGNMGYIFVDEILVN